MIIPAMFMLVFALIIIALIPLALRAIAYRPLGAAAILRRNMLVYAVGGVVVPFVGIKVIDVFLVATGLAWRLLDERARLRGYVGAAPGVGKTCEMMRDAHGLRDRGLDVVIGFVDRSTNPPKSSRR